MKFSTILFESFLSAVYCAVNFVYFNTLLEGPLLGGGGGGGGRGGRGEIKVR